MIVTYRSLGPDIIRLVVLSQTGPYAEKYIFETEFLFKLNQTMTKSIHISHFKYKDMINTIYFIFSIFTTTCFSGFSLEFLVFHFHRFFDN